MESLFSFHGRDVQAKGTFMTTIKLKPVKTGSRQIVAKFNSDLLADINGTFDVQVN
jgi:hypothetical protein